MLSRQVHTVQVHAQSPSQPSAADEAGIAYAVGDFAQHLGLRMVVGVRHNTYLHIRILNLNCICMTSYYKVVKCCSIFLVATLYQHCTIQ